MRLWLLNTMLCDSNDMLLLVLVVLHLQDFRVSAWLLGEEAVSSSPATGGSAAGDADEAHSMYAASLYTHPHQEKEEEGDGSGHNQVGV